MDHTRLRPLIHLALDFDSTLTTSDTLAALAAIPYTLPNPPPIPFADLVRDYSADLQAHTDKFNTSTSLSNRTSIPNELKWLNSLRKIESDSENRVRPLFKDVRRKDIELAAERALKEDKVSFREGWLSLIRRIINVNASRSEKICLDIISVNWSRGWILSLLKCAVSIEGDLSLYSNIRIWANEVSDTIARQFEGEIRGEIVDLKTSGDKVRIFEQCRGDAWLASHNGKAMLSIYIGDSATDLETLLAADVGICIRNQPPSHGQRDLQETCERLHVEVRPWSDVASSHIFQIRDRNASRSTDELCWANNFSEITQCFDGISDP